MGQPASRRMAGVDGLRAAAALWVVVFHAWGYSGHRHWFGPAGAVIENGALGVSLFLVLSGFCLYIPFAGGRVDRFRAVTFLWRRCRRLLPAYYVALAGTLALTAAAGHVLGPSAPRSAHDLGWQAITHLTLTHNLFPTTYYAMNGVFWSLGLEWQLYLLLALLVIGVRRIGLRATIVLALACNALYLVAVSLAVGAGLVADRFLADPVLPNQALGRWSEFLLGMVAAELAATGQAARWARRLAPIALPLAAAVLLLPHQPWTYLASGGVFFVLLLSVLQPGGVVARAFSWRPLVAVGVMSYSVYLVHEPLVAMLAYLLRVKLHASPGIEFGALLACIPLVLAVAFALFITVERRTLLGSGEIPPATDFVPGWMTRRLPWGPSPAPVPAPRAQAGSAPL